MVYHRDMDLHRSPTTIRWIAPLVGALVACSGLAPRAEAQISGQGIPSIGYQATFRAYHEGEYRDALKSFTREGRGSIKNVQSRWIDAICYDTMAGECYYQMGQLPDALACYTSAVRLYVAFSDWMLRVQFPPTIRPATQSRVRERPTWGQSKRQSPLGDFPRTMMMSQGKVDLNETFRQGGVVEKPMLFGIDVVEIVRCTTLAIRRRAELLGPASRHDPLTGQLLGALTRRPGVPNHWSECWIDVQLGLAEIAAGKDLQAAANLERSLLAAGQFDHPLTATALFELGRLALGRGDLKIAADHFLEATYSAAYYGDIGLLEEAFRYAAMVHVVAGQKSVYPPLAHAMRWAQANRYRQLQGSLALALVENHAVLGQTKAAGAMLDEAGAILGRRDMAAGLLGARHSWLSALVHFQQGNTAAGDRAVAAAMDYMRAGSHRLFHIGLADKLYVDGAITARVATDLYAEVLRDPTAADWRLDPMESLATLVMPHPIPLEHWFEVAIEHREHEKALEIADRARRHRFFSTLPFGGRLASLRWILEGPEQVLGTEDRLQRRELRVQFPEYEKLSGEAAQRLDELAKAPAVPQDETANLQREQLNALGELSRRQEAVLREIAVRRQPAGLVFPPLRTTEAIQKSLAPGSALLVFFSTNRHLYAFLLNNQRYDYWRIGAPTALNKRVMGLLQDLGHFDANRTIASKDLVSDRWLKSAQALLDAVLAGSKADFAADFDELIIVPDGVLWYAPFEALQVEVDGQLQSLASRLRIRYAPTASLAVPDGRRRKAIGRTGVVVGRLFPSDDPAVAEAACEQLAAVLPGTVALPAPPPAPSSLYRIVFDRLVVYDDIQPSKGGPYGWEPIQLERGKPGNTLGDWMSLPWGGPETIILPGFHTAAENAMKQLQGATAGHEVFLSVCGLMSSGAKTVLLSRWRSGGQTSFDLTREFAQELPHVTPSEAMQRAMLLVSESRVNLDAEPRIKRATGDNPLGSHPLFWSGYMLFDVPDPAP